MIRLITERLLHVPAALSIKRIQNCILYMYKESVPKNLSSEQQSIHTTCTYMHLYTDYTFSRKMMQQLSLVVTIVNANVEGVHNLLQLAQLIQVVRYHGNCSSILVHCTSTCSHLAEFENNYAGIPFFILQSLDYQMQLKLFILHVQSCRLLAQTFKF